MSYVGRAAFSGALWNVGGAACNKVFTIAGQLALAWLLTPLDFGIASLAFGVASVATLIGSSGLRQVLVQDRNESPGIGNGFWMALALDVAAAMTVAASAPVAAYVFHDARVGKALWIVALAYPLQTLSVVPMALLYRQLRFREVTLINAGQGVTRTGAAVALAAAGCGPYSLVIPIPITHCFTAITLRFTAGHIAIPRPRLDAWKAWLPSSVWASALSFLNGLQAYGPVLVLGLVASSDEVGFFSWGYAVAGQALFLAATSLRTVLFPSFAALDESRRPDAFRTAARLMWLVSAPLCIVQAISAAPFLSLLFGQRWVRAIPVIVWTSLGLLALPLDVLGESVLSAKGEFRRLVALRSLQVLSMMAVAVAPGNSAGVVAERVCLVLLVTQVLAGLVAWRSIADGSRSMLMDFLPTATALALATGIALVTQRLLVEHGAFWTLLMSVGSFGLGYIGLVSWLSRSVVQDLLRRLRTMTSDQ